MERKQNQQALMIAGSYKPFQQLKAPLFYPLATESNKKPTLKKNRVKKDRNPYIRMGLWCRQEIVTYILFMKTFMSQFTSSTERRLKKSFLRMSQAIKTRDPDQCRSHHQKMLVYRNSVQEIIRYYSLLYPEIQSGPMMSDQENQVKQEQNSQNEMERSDSPQVLIEEDSNNIRIFLPPETIANYAQQ